MVSQQKNGAHKRITGKTRSGLFSPEWAKPARRRHRRFKILRCVGLPIGFAFNLFEASARAVKTPGLGI